MALHHDVIRHATSSQGSLIVAVVLLAFIVWITLQGHLSGYLADLGFGRRAKAQAAAANIAGGIVGGNGALNLFGNPATAIPALPAIPGVTAPPQ